MKKATISSLVMIALLVGAYVFVTSRDNLAIAQPDGAQTTNGTSDGRVSGTLPELVAMNRDLSCTLDEREGAEGEAEISGRLHISDQRLRGDFTIEDPDQQQERIEMHTVHDGDRVYMWSTLREDGTVMRVNDMQQNGQTGVMGNMMMGDDATGQTAGVTYTCQDWEVDETRFNPPEDREFVDITDEVRELGTRLQEVERQEITREDCEALEDPQNRQECLQIIQQMEQQGGGQQVQPRSPQQEDGRQVQPQP